MGRVPTPPLAFASSAPLGDDELRARRPAARRGRARLAAPLELKPAPAAKAAERLGLHTVGDLLEHLPRDRARRARSPSWSTDEVATVAVEVRSITSRPVRRRGMKPLVEATVADETGIMKVTFFNQPWLERRYRPGTRLMLQGKYQGRNRFRVQFHAETGELVGATGDVAQYPATEGLSTTQIPALVHEHRAALATSSSRSRRGCAPPAAARPRRRARRRALRRRRAGPAAGSRSRSCCCSSSRCCGAARCGARPRAPSALDEPPSLTARWLAESLPFTPTGDQRKAMEAIDGDLASDRPMQRLLMGEVGSGKTVVALYAMLRAVEHGGQAALMAPTETLAEQHFATIQALMPGELVPAALLTGSTPAARRADMLGKLAARRADAARRHARADRGRRRLRPARRRGRRRAAPLRRAPARALDRKAPDGLAPHVLHMTATPIPRTLALTAYGDLDVTVLRQLPARPPADRDARRLDRARARARLRADPRGAAAGPPGVRRLPARRGVRGAAGARRDRRVRAAAHDRVARLPRRADARPDAAAREAGGDGGVRRRRRRRARRHDRDRGRDRRAERDR